MTDETLQLRYRQARLTSEPCRCAIVPPPIYQQLIELIELNWNSVDDTNSNDLFLGTIEK